MLNGGGRAIEDIREIKIDEGLRELLCAWLRRMGKGAKVWFFNGKDALILINISCLAHKSHFYNKVQKLLASDVLIILIGWPW